MDISSGTPTQYTVTEKGSWGELGDFDLFRWFSGYLYVSSFDVEASPPPSAAIGGAYVLRPMKDWLPGAFGVATIAVIALGIIGWVSTRRLLLSPHPTSPASAIMEGWRAVLQAIRVLPLVASLGFAVKLLQILAHSGLNLLLQPSIAGRVWASVAIELLFTLAWAATAFRIYLLVLAPNLPRGQVRERTRRAVLYALLFWVIAFVLTIGGTLWIATLHGRSRPIVIVLVTSMPYIFIILSALTRPAIAMGLPKPFKECRRILRENWFGVAVTLGLAALPLGLVFLAVGLTRQFGHLPVMWALLLEVPIAAISALSYAAWEGAVAAMYRRIV
jgi:hypothetical protein